MNELSVQFDVNPVMISKWKTEFLENMNLVFEKERGSLDQSDSSEMDKLYAQIGQLKVENDFLKKVAGNWGYETTHRHGIYQSS